MIEITIPGYKTLQLRHIVLDYNGTMAVDGELIPGVGDALKSLAKDLQVHILTADTFGKVRSRVEGIPCELSILPVDNQDQGKLDYVKRVGAKHSNCILDALKLLTNPLRLTATLRS
jgi:soluble P-type ATPase